jgi:hypothetical protein
VFEFFSAIEAREKNTPSIPGTMSLSLSHAFDFNACDKKVLPQTGGTDLSKSCSNREKTPENFPQPVEML